jgi:hypothetical protein
MGSSTPCCSAARRGASLLLLLLPLLVGCLGSTPERASISDARLVEGAAGPLLEVTQQLRLSDTMLAALDSGIPLRLAYRVGVCRAQPQGVTVELRFIALTGSYEMRLAGQSSVRRFARRSAMLAALDRVRLPLDDRPPADCAGDIAVALDLTSLPTPLRFPAFLQPGEWRLVSPSFPWHGAPG